MAQQLLFLALALLLLTLEVCRLNGKVSTGDGSGFGDNGEKKWGGKCTFN